MKTACTRRLGLPKSAPDANTRISSAGTRISTSEFGRRSASACGISSFVPL